MTLPRFRACLKSLRASLRLHVDLKAMRSSVNSINMVVGWETVSGKDEQLRSVKIGIWTLTGHVGTMAGAPHRDDSGNNTYCFITLRSDKSVFFLDSSFIVLRWSHGRLYMLCTLRSSVTYVWCR